MSVSTTFFIEFFNKKTDKWERLTSYIPFKEEEKGYYDDAERTYKTTRTKPDVLNPELKENPIELTYQGYVRDLFTRTMSSKFEGRGLPKDISEGSKKFFDNEEEKLQKRKAGLSQEDSKWITKWFWGETYATLSELEGLEEKLYTEWKTRIIDTSRKGVVLDKLDEILSLLKKTEPGTSIDAEYAEEDLEYEFNEHYWDLMQLSGFIATIKMFVETLYPYVYYSSDKIRVIAHSC